jgi:hypothetical protein
MFCLSMSGHTEKRDAEYFTSEWIELDLILIRSSVASSLLLLQLCKAGAARSDLSGWWAPLGRASSPVGEQPSSPPVPGGHLLRMNGEVGSSCYLELVRAAAEVARWGAVDALSARALRRTSSPAA